jgi:hypothetical protein
MSQLSYIDESRVTPLLTSRLSVFSVLILLSLWSFECEARWPSTQIIALQAVDEVERGVRADSSADTHQSDTSENEERGDTEIKASSDSLQVLIVSELMGYIEPCGCTIDLTLGAIERLSAQIKALRSKGPTIVLTAGSHLFEHDHVKAHSRAQEEAKARLICSVFSEIGVDAHISGPLDLAGGLDFYRSMQAQHPLTEVTLNYSELSPQGQARLIDHKGIKVGVFGVVASSLKHSPAGSHGSTHGGDSDTYPHQKIKTRSPEEEIIHLKALTAQATQTLKSQGAHIVIGLAVASRLIVRKLAEQSPEVDLWVLGEKAQEESSLSPIIFSTQSSAQQRAYIVEAGDRGRNLAALKFSQLSEQGDFSDPQGDHARALKKLRLKLKMKEKFASRMPNPMMKRQVSQLQARIAEHERTSPRASGKRVEYQLIPITDQLPTDDKVYARVKAYQDSLQELNQAARKVKPPPANGNGYAGREECGLCHPDAQSFWEKTKHAKAWSTLVKAQKTFDVECVSCHVTGWQEPGGSALGHTDRLQDVQCEACHGPAAKHAEMGGGEAYVKLKVPSQRCETCHNQKHSPKFNYERYLKEVIGPGHGAPLTEE